MGAKGSSALKKKDLKDFEKNTHFETDEIHALYNHYQGIASRKDDAVDRSEFLSTLGTKESFFLDRMFQLFDTNNDGLISFSEYLNGLSVLSNRGTLEEKTSFSFRMYDLDGDDKISPSELSQMLKASLKELDVKFTPGQIEAVISSTFEAADLSKSGYINLNEYRSLVNENPTILSNMTLDFHRVIELRLAEQERTIK